MADDKRLNIVIDVEGIEASKQAMGELVNSFKKASTEAGNLGGQVGNMAKGFVAGNLMLRAIDAVGDAFKAAAKDAIDYRRELLAIETILPRGATVTTAMKNALEDLSISFGLDKSEMARNYYKILSAGIDDTSNASKILKSATELAIGGLAKTESTINLLTTAYNTYGAEMVTTTEAADSLFKTAQLGKTNIEELSSAMGKSLPLAKQFGLSFDEVGSILATFTNKGNTTSQSVTLLNALLTAIAKKGDKLGEGMNLAAVQTDGLAVVMERLIKKTGGGADQLSKLLGRQEAVRGALYLSEQGVKAYNEQLDQYSDKAGLAAEASKKMIEGDVAKQWDILKQQALGVTNIIGQEVLPILNDWLSKLIEINNEARIYNRENRNVMNSLTAGDDFEELVTYEEYLSQLIKKQKEYQDTIKSGTFDDYTDDLKEINAEISKMQGLIKAKPLPTIATPTTSVTPTGGTQTVTPTNKTATEEEIKAANKLAKERLDLSIKTDNAIIQSKMNFYASLSEMQRRNTEIFSLEEKAAMDMQLVAFTEQDAARLSALQLQIQYEKDAEKQKTLNKQLEVETRMALTRKEIEDEKKAAEEKKAAAELEAEMRMTKLQMYFDADEQQQANREYFSQIEQEQFDALQEKYTQADAEKIVKMQNMIALEKDAAMQSVMTKQLEIFQKSAEERKYWDDVKNNVQTGLNLGNAAVSAGLAFAKKGTRERKNLLRAQVVMDTASGIMKAYSESGPVLGSVFAALIAIKGAGQLREIDKQNFAGGGIYNPGGTSINGDSRSLNGGAVGINDREMILNMQQQANLFRSINSGGMGGNSMQLELLVGIRDAIMSKNYNTYLNGSMLSEELERNNERYLV